jgi:hypothetical protein
MFVRPHLISPDVVRGTWIRTHPTYEFVSETQAPKEPELVGENGASSRQQTPISSFHQPQRGKVPKYTESGCSQFVNLNNGHQISNFYSISESIAPQGAIIGVGLLQSCRLVKDEIIPILYGENTFHFDAFDCLSHDNCRKYPELDRETKEFSEDVLRDFAKLLGATEDVPEWMLKDNILHILHLIGSNNSSHIKSIKYNAVMLPIYSLTVSGGTPFFHGSHTLAFSHALTRLRNIKLAGYYDMDGWEYVRRDSCGSFLDFETEEGGSNLGFVSESIKRLVKALPWVETFQVYDAPKKFQTKEFWNDVREAKALDLHGLKYIQFGNDVEPRSAMGMRLKPRIDESLSIRMPSFQNGQNKWSRRFYRSEECRKKKRVALVLPDRSKMRRDHLFPGLGWISSPSQPNGTNRQLNWGEMMEMQNTIPNVEGNGCQLVRKIQPASKKKNGGSTVISRGPALSGAPTDSEWGPPVPDPDLTGPKPNCSGIAQKSTLVINPPIIKQLHDKDKNLTPITARIRTAHFEHRVAQFRKQKLETGKIPGEPCLKRKFIQVDGQRRMQAWADTQQSEYEIYARETIWKMRRVEAWVEELVQAQYLEDEFGS